MNKSVDEVKTVLVVEIPFEVKSREKKKEVAKMEEVVITGMKLLAPYLEEVEINQIKVSVNAKKGSFKGSLKTTVEILGEIGREVLNRLRIAFREDTEEKTTETIVIRPDGTKEKKVKRHFKRKRVLSFGL